MSSKIILGGAQLGLNYGITDQNFCFGRNNSKDILYRAKELGITVVDIAYGYGEIFGWINEINPGLNVISKVNLFQENYNKEVLDKHLHLENLTSILIHDADNFLFNKRDIQKVNEFLEFCERNNFRWGLSLYGVKILSKFLEQGWVPNIVQYPLNVLFSGDDIGLLCDQTQIETHIRSVMLQGLLVGTGVHELPNRFRDNSSLVNWYDWIVQQRLNPIDVCLRGDSIFHRTKILGVKNADQLQDLVVRSTGCPVDCATLPKSADSKLLDPRSWTAV